VPVKTVEQQTLQPRGSKRFPVSACARRPHWSARSVIFTHFDEVSGIRVTIRFFVVDEDVDLTFAKDPQGHVVEMRALASGQNVVA
jgi:hypothetical protein